MKLPLPLLLGIFFLVAVPAVYGQHFIHVDSLDAPPVLTEEAVKIPKREVKRLAKKGKTVTSTYRFLTVIYQNVIYPATARMEKDGERTLEVELLIDSSGVAKPGDIYLLGAEPQLGPTSEKIVITAYTVGPGNVTENEPTLVPGTDFTQGEVALANEVLRVLSILPQFAPGQLNGKPVNSRMILHFDFRRE